MTSRNTRRILSTVAVMAALGAAVLAEGGTVLAWDGPPQITPLCSGGPNAATDYEWEVTFGQVESNYNVDYSPTGLPGELVPRHHHHDHAALRPGDASIARSGAVRSVGQ